MAFVVGLTGGIGSGKTTVANLFAEAGVDVVDTDQISHSITQAGAPAVAAIAERFGRQYIGTDGALDRPRMRQLVFSDAQARKDLESILHPLIRQETRQRVAGATSAYVIVVVPLLLETGNYLRFVQRVLVVDCDPDLQVDRVAARSGLPRKEVQAIMATQATREERLQGADDVIRNDGGLAELRSQVEILHRKYLQLAVAA